MDRDCNDDSDVTGLETSQMTGFFMIGIESSDSAILVLLCYEYVKWLHN
jgi:hypothetical protein